MTDPVDPKPDPIVARPVETEAATDDQGAGGTSAPIDRAGAPTDGYTEEGLSIAPTADRPLAHPVLAPHRPAGERGEEVLARFGFTGDTLTTFLAPVPEPDRKKSTTRLAAFLHENGLSHFGGATITEKRDTLIRLCHSLPGEEIPPLLQALVATNRAGAIPDFLSRVSISPGENPLVLAREVFAEAADELTADYLTLTRDELRGTTQWTEAVKKMRSLVLAGFHREALQRILFVWVRALRLDGASNEQAAQTSALILATLVTPHTDDELASLAARAGELPRYQTARRIVASACRDLTPQGRLGGLFSKYFPERTTEGIRNPLAARGFTEAQIDRLMEWANVEREQQAVRIFLKLLDAGILEKLSDQPDQAREMFVELLSPFAPRDRNVAAKHLEAMCLARFDMPPILSTLLHRHDRSPKDKVAYLEQKLTHWSEEILAIARTRPAEAVRLDWKSIREALLALKSRRSVENLVKAWIETNRENNPVDEPERETLEKLLASLLVHVNDTHLEEIIGLARQDLALVRERAIAFFDGLRETETRSRRLAALERLLPAGKEGASSLPRAVIGDGEQRLASQDHNSPPASSVALRASGNSAQFALGLPAQVSLLAPLSLRGGEGELLPVVMTVEPTPGHRDTKTSGHVVSKVPRVHAWDGIEITPTTEMHRRVREAVALIASPPPAIEPGTRDRRSKPAIVTGETPPKTVSPDFFPSGRIAPTPPKESTVQIPAVLQHELRLFVAQHEVAEDGFTVSIDMGRGIVEKRFSPTQVRALLGSHAERTSVTHVAIAMASHLLTRGERGRAEAILHAMDAIFGHRLFWDRRLSALEWLTPEQLLSLNPKAITALRKGNPIYLVPGRYRFWTDEDGHLWNPFRIETEFAYVIAGPPVVELKLQWDMLLVTDAKGTNCQLIAQMLKRAGLAGWSPEFAERMEKEESKTNLDANALAAVWALREGLKFYLEQTGLTADGGLTLDIDTGTELVRETITSRIVEALRDGKIFLKRGFVSLAQGLLTYLCSLPDDADTAPTAVQIAAEIIATMNRQFGNRLAWDWRLAAFKTMTVDDILATDRKGADDLRAGDRIYFGGINTSALLKTGRGAFASAMKLSAGEPIGHAPHVQLRLRDGKLLIYQDEGHRSTLLTKILVESGLAKLTPFYTLMHAGSHERLLALGGENPDSLREALEDYYGDDLPSQIWIVGSNRVTLNIENQNCGHLICQDFVPTQSNTQYLRLRVTLGGLVVDDFKGSHGKNLARTLVAAGLAARGFPMTTLERPDSLDPSEPLPAPRETAPARSRATGPAGSKRKRAKAMGPEVDRAPTPPQEPRPETTTAPVRKRVVSQPPPPVLSDPDPESQQNSELLAHLLTTGAVRYTFEWTGDDESITAALRAAGLRENEVNWFVEEVLDGFKGKNAVDLMVTLCLKRLKSKSDQQMIPVRIWVVRVLANLARSGEFHFSWERTVDEDQMAVWLRSAPSLPGDVDLFLEKIRKGQFDVATWLGQINPTLWGQSRAVRERGRGRPEAPAAARGPVSSATFHPGDGKDDPRRTKGSVHQGLVLGDAAPLMLTDGALALKADYGPRVIVSMSRCPDVLMSNTTTSKLPDIQTSRHPDIRTRLISLANSRGLSEVARFLARLNESQLKRLIVASAGFNKHDRALSRIDRLLAFTASRIGAREDLPPSLLATANASLPATALVAPAPATLGTGSPVVNLLK